MSVLVVSEVPGVTAEQDAAMVKALNLEEAPPAGARARLASPTANGWRVVSLWDSEEQWVRFRDETLAPALQQVGRSVPPAEISPLESVLIV